MADQDARHFLLRKLHSLAGVLPLTVFLFEHFYSNSKATVSPGAFNEMVEFFEHLPYLPFIEIGVLAVPILFHGIYGTVIVAQARSNVSGYSYWRNVAFFLQRLTGVVLLVGIAYHVWMTRMQHVLHGTEIDFAYMQHYLSDTGVFVFYVAFVVAAAFHLANGLWGFGVSWGLLRSPRAQEGFGYASMVLFALLAVAGVNILFAFRLA